MWLVPSNSFIENFPVNVVRDKLPSIENRGLIYLTKKISFNFCVVDILNLYLEK